MNQIYINAKLYNVKVDTIKPPNKTVCKYVTHSHEYFTIGIIYINLLNNLTFFRGLYNVSRLTLERMNNPTKTFTVNCNLCRNYSNKIVTLVNTKLSPIGHYSPIHLSITPFGTPLCL